MLICHPDPVLLELRSHGLQRPQATAGPPTILGRARILGSVVTRDKDHLRCTIAREFSPGDVAAPAGNAIIAHRQDRRSSPNRAW